METPASAKEFTTDAGVFFATNMETRNYGKELRHLKSYIIDNDAIKIVYFIMYAICEIM